MTSTTTDSVSAMRNLALLQNDNTFQQFCTLDDYEDAITTLFEELGAFEVPAMTDIPSKPLTKKDIEPSEILKYLFVKLMNSTANLIHQHRSLIKNHEKLREQQSRVSVENTSLINQVRRLKETVAKKENNISEILERERQLNVKFGTLHKEFKREKEENVKLRKQLQSKDVQHAHEIRRIQQNGNKLREQLQKSVGTYVPKNKAAQNLKTDYENKIHVYKQTINRLEINNGLMLQELTELKDALQLHTGDVALRVESSSILG